MTLEDTKKILIDRAEQYEKLRDDADKKSISRMVYDGIVFGLYSALGEIEEVDE